ncbi:hypothetical protein L6E12_18005 [Actinokineospora sp. PR83]|uniref:hypothetical protein n=1 Tax=Actinokineospora sp. PR83 TaxID=2884908 RepID=UPI001F23FCE8|nr:hypothetical protein [Actinokineospora sp. PR83]MCG8917681.1 hypothetical protein [Actinokineospora sp. PR83]
MDVLTAEAGSRGQVGLELLSVDSTIVRAHHESAGPAIAGETLDALEQGADEGRRGSVAHPAAGAAGDQPRAAADQESAGTSADQDRAALRRRRTARAKAAGPGAG